MHHASRCHMERDGTRGPHRGPTQGTHPHTQGTHTGDRPTHRGPTQRAGGPHRGPTTGGEATQGTHTEHTQTLNKRRPRKHYHLSSSSSSSQKENRKAWGDTVTRCAVRGVQCGTTPIPIYRDSGHHIISTQRLISSHYQHYQVSPFYFSIISNNIFVPPAPPSS